MDKQINIKKYINKSKDKDPIFYTLATYQLLARDQSMACGQGCPYTISQLATPSSFNVNHYI